MNTKNLESKVLKTIKNLYITKSFPSCASVPVEGTNLKVSYSVGEHISEYGSSKLFSFSIIYFKNGILVTKTPVFHLNDAGDFLDLNLTKIINDLILKAEKKIELFKNEILELN